MMIKEENVTIMIIDDSSVNNLLLENVFESEGYQVKVALNAEDAFEMINEEKPDLILLDIMMPGIDGYNILKKLKNDSLTKDIPVIMISAKSDKIDIEKSIELGASDYIIKPINIKDILDKINQQLTK